MQKRTLGMLIGAAAGFIGWYLRQEHEPVDLYIELHPREEGGGCRVKRKPDDTDLHWKQKVRWNITNYCDRQIRVSLESWRHTDPKELPTSPAATPEGMPGLWQKVDGNGGTGTIKGKARFGLGEECRYDIYLDDEPGEDPIVKLVV
jgi:hypothetical protein